MEPWRAPTRPRKSADNSGRSRRSSQGPFERVRPGDSQDWRSLLGRKVSVRYRTSAGEKTAAAEAIGVVMSVGVDEVGSERVQIVTRRGAVRSVPIGEIVAGKVWPAEG